MIDPESLAREIDEAATLMGGCLIVDVQRMGDAFRDCIAALAEWLPGASLTLDRRRYSRARRKAVRAILAALAPREADHA